MRKDLDRDSCADTPGTAKADDARGDGKRR
jgi:hypothetical protein